MTKLRTPAPAGQANGVAAPSTGGPQIKVGSPQVGDSLSPDVTREAYGLVSRVIKSANVDAVAGECGVDRSTIFKWAKKPGRVYVGALETLAEYDPDPEGLSRIAGALLAAMAKRALARKAAGESVTIFHQTMKGWVR